MLIVSDVHGRVDRFLAKSVTQSNKVSFVWIELKRNPYFHVKSEPTQTVMNHMNGCDRVGYPSKICNF